MYTIEKYLHVCIELPSTFVGYFESNGVVQYEEREAGKV